MSDIQILKELIKSSENGNDKQNTVNSEDETDTEKPSFENDTSSDADALSTGRENLKSPTSSHVQSDQIKQIKNIKNAEDNDNYEDDDDDEHDFLLDMDEQRVQMENLSTLLSMFFQDDRGLNVVEAIVQNSKVQNKISKSLDKIIEILTKKNMT